MTAFEDPVQILVTGGAGFVGSNVVKVLRTRYPKARVRVLHLAAENRFNLKDVDGIELLAGDITVAADVERAVNGCDVVFHLAAIYSLWLPDMSLMQRVNVEGTRLLLAECLRQQVRRVIYTSSAVCFAGQGQDTVSDERSPFSMQSQAYAVSKHASHQVAEDFFRQGLDVVIVCPAAPMGPGDLGPTPTGRVITDTFRMPVAFAVRSEINIIDVRDCAMGHVLALEKGRGGESYILGGENYRYADMLRRVFRICGIKRRVWVIPAVLLWPLSHLLLWHAKRTKKAPIVTPAEIDVGKRGLVCNAGKARCELGLTVRPLEQTLRDALNWFRTNGYIDAPAVEETLAQYTTDSSIESRS